MLRTTCSSNLIEFGLHACLNFLSVYALTSNLFALPHSEIQVFTDVLVLTTLGGIACCSMLRTGTRMSSWIGFSLLSQLTFIALLLVGDSGAHIHSTASGLFVVLCALHLTTCDWEKDLIDGLAVMLLHIRLIRVVSDPATCSHGLISCGVFFALNLGIRWFKSKSNPQSHRNIFLETLYIVSLCALESVLWTDADTTDTSVGLAHAWPTLLALGFALVVRQCRLGLCAPELLLLYGFVQVASASLVNAVASSEEEHRAFHRHPASASSCSVLAVSGVGVQGVLLFGVVAALGMNGAVQCRWVVSTAKPAAALLFVLLLLGVIGGFMVPGMHYSIVACAGLRLSELRLVALPPTWPAPLLWIADFLLVFRVENIDLLFSFPPRLGVCLYWVLCLVVFLPCSQHICREYSHHVSQIASRKLFHFLSVAMFAPVVLLDQHMMLLSFAVALCALLLVEYVRYFNIWSVRSSPLNEFFVTFMDERDLSRKIALTHIQLLLGCALPFVLSFAMDHVSARRDCPAHQLLPYLGLITVGIGDAAAAIVGSKFGRRRWVQSSAHNKRTLEGTLGGSVAMYAVAALISSTLLPVNQVNTALTTERTVLATTVLTAAIIESFTSEADNIVMPLAAAVAYLSLGMLLQQ